MTYSLCGAAREVLALRLARRAGIDAAAARIGIKLDLDQEPRQPASDINPPERGKPGQTRFFLSFWMKTWISPRDYELPPLA